MSDEQSACRSRRIWRQHRQCSICCFSLPSPFLSSKILFISSLILNKTDIQLRRVLLHIMKSPRELRKREKNDEERRHSQVITS